MRIVCAVCGSEDIRKDAVASWNVALQQWELVAVFDDPNFCEDCGGETSLEEVDQ